MVRTKIRGILAAFVVTGVSGAVLGGTAIANGAVGTDEFTKPLPLAAQRAAMHWQIPAVPGLRGLGRHKHARRHREHRSGLTGSPQTVAHTLVTRRGWDASQWSCLDSLWTRESDWETGATNASSGAYGIPQALPAGKMAAAGSDWRTNPITQIRWGLDYIAASYGSPCNALAHSNSYGYY